MKADLIEENKDLIIVLDTNLKDKICLEYLQSNNTLFQVSVNDENVLLLPVKYKVIEEVKGIEKPPEEKKTTLSKTPINRCFDCPYLIMRDSNFPSCKEYDHIVTTNIEKEKPDWCEITEIAEEEVY